MNTRIITALAALAALALPRVAGADPDWRSEFVCDFDDEAGAESARVSPLHDEEQAELTQFGHSWRLVGNKSFTRTKTHSWVGFTFDDGPSYKTTPKVLDILEKYDVPATFFVAGWRLTGKKHPKLVKRNVATLRETVRRGFHVGNHTHRHKNLHYVPAKVYKTEIERGAQAIEDITGVRPHLVRFPYGVIAQQLRDYLDQEGYTEVRWNIDSGDYWAPSAKYLRKRTLQQIISWDGGVVLFHDTKTLTVRALPGILDDLEALNCKRLKSGKPLLLPVSLHYFAREKNGKLRPVPPEVAARTERYRKKLPARCKARIDKNKSTN